jgi:hypothetical protein
VIAMNINPGPFAIRTATARERFRMHHRRARLLLQRAHLLVRARTDRRGATSAYCIRLQLRAHARSNGVPQARRLGGQRASPLDPKRLKDKNSGGKCPPDTEPQDAVPGDGVELVAAGRTEAVWITVPGTPGRHGSPLRRRSISSRRSIKR